MKFVAFALLVGFAIVVCGANNSGEILYEPTIMSCRIPNRSGAFKISNLNRTVYCEMDSFDGGWLVFQQRADYTLNFHRGWSEYRTGFGTIGKDSDFWLGLDTLHQITKDGTCELATETKDASGNYKYARYSSFGVASSSYYYKLTVGGYTGTDGNPLSQHNNAKFSTYNSDSDGYSGNCAQSYASGWWYHSGCYNCNYNYASGSYKNSRMMVRCK